MAQLLVSSKPRGYVYDLETLNNCFTAIFLNKDNNQIFEFVIHRDRDDRIALYNFLNISISNKDMYLGYNNLFFDGIIINYLIDNKQQLLSCFPSAAAELIYNKAQNIITSNTEPAQDQIYYIKQLDVYKLNHYDRRKVSLKTLQGSMRWYNMQDMPIHHSTKVNKEDIPKILEYNKNDVESTFEFYKHIKSEIDLRKIVSKNYKFNALNFSSTKIGETIFTQAICNSLNTTPKELKALTKKNQVIKIKEIIFDYIDLKQKPFKAMQDYLETQEVIELKGFFTAILLDDNTKIIEPYISKNKNYYVDKFKLSSILEGFSSTEQSIIKAKIKSNPQLYKISKPLIKKLNIVHYDNTFVIGSGGIHSVHNTLKSFKKRKGRLLVDIDFSSYYPNLCMANNWFPEHLGKTFVEEYKILYNERSYYKNLAKNDKSDLESSVMQLALKLSLNSVN